VKPHERTALAGEIPSPVAPPRGCRFPQSGARRRRTSARPRKPQIARSRPSSRRLSLPDGARRDPCDKGTARALRQTPWLASAAGKHKWRWARMFLFTWRVPPSGSGAPAVRRGRGPRVPKRVGHEDVDTRARSRAARVSVQAASRLLPSGTIARPWSYAGARVGEKNK